MSDESLLSPAAQERVNAFINEVMRRFPEVQFFNGDEELPYVVAGLIVDWLVSLVDPHVPDAAAERVADFDRWCITQPQGESAADDIPTIWLVGFRERLLSHEALVPLIPLLMPREDLLRNHQYFRTWVGADRLQAALNAYPRRMKRVRKR